jgi:hypothetical protein
MQMPPSGLPSTAMPDESPQPGDGSAGMSGRKALESAGSPGRPPSQGGAPPPQGASPAPQGGPPVQPPPRVPLTQDDMKPGGPVFMQPQTGPAPSWRQQLRTWAQHPEARIMKQLSERADAGLQGKPPDQQ